MKEGSRITKSEENKKCSCFPYCMRIAVFCMVMLVSVVTLIPHAVCAEERNCTFINSNVNRQNYIVWSPVCEIVSWGGTGRLLPCSSYSG